MQKFPPAPLFKNLYAPHYRAGCFFFAPSSRRALEAVLCTPVGAELSLVVVLIILLILIVVLLLLVLVLILVVLLILVLVLIIVLHHDTLILLYCVSA